MFFSNIEISFDDPNVPIPAINTGVLPGMNDPVDFWEIDNLSVGVTTVTITITDDCGNNDSHDFTITVFDVTGPVVDNCPDDIVISTEAGICSAEASWINATGTDNCDVSSFDVSYGPVTCLLYTSPSPRDATLSRMPSSA